MAEIFTVKPSFDKFRNQIKFPAKQLNAFALAEIVDSWSTYQSLFKVYNFMELNSMFKYVLHTMSGQPFMWQPHLNCGWDDTGSIRIGSEELEPCKAKINESWCYDELFDSCFDHFLKWDGRGAVRLDDNGVAVFNKLVRNMTQQAQLGAILTLTVGKLYDVHNVEFSAKTPANIESLFKRTMNTCRGWVELAREMGEKAGYEHMNVPDVFKASDFQGDNYVGDAITLFDQLRDNASNELQAMLDEGGVTDSINGLGQVLMLVSSSIHKAIATEYRKQCISNTCTNPRLSMELMGGKKIYKIDDIPVVPISHINYADRYLKGKTHLAALTAAGNISLGTSIGEIRTNNPLDAGMGIMIQRDENLQNYGKYYFMSHALFSTAIANTDLYVGTQVYTEAD
jgi:hypothetical protein